MKYKRDNKEITVPEGLSYEDIRISYHTGRFIRNHSSQEKHAGMYRSGMMTKIGDVEESDWYTYAETLISKNADDELFGKLKSWYREHCAWLRSEKEVHRYSLECFVAGVHNNPEWADYAAFNSIYRPELI